jgi:hypothetical protein
MKRISKLLLCLAIMAMTLGSVPAQNAAKNWIFGNRGWIDFNTVPPSSPILPSNSTFVTSEGSSSISDSNGSLLFYTDGVKVWNKSHTVMPHGTGLAGSATSTQSALIVPCNCNKYFIFTTGAWDSPTAGVRYSVVDTIADGGNGDITALKNIQLLAAPAAEKLAAVKDGNGGFWVVAHDERVGATGAYGNIFYAYHLLPGDCSVNQTAVTSGVGSYYTGGSHRFGAGQMKISPDGKRLAVAGFDNTAGFIELFKFDTATGKVSDLDGTVRQVIARTAYGIEFSPNSQYLYASVRSTTGNSIFRYDISGNTLPPPGWTFNFWVKKRPVGSLQLGPDQKIYVAVNGSPYLYVIDNLEGASPPTVSTFTLSSAGSTFGLPAMVAGDFACGGIALPGGGCACDQVTQTPFWTPDLSLAWKAFSIYNVKSPGSDIKWIDIDISDSNGQPPPQSPWSGGGLRVNGTALAVPDWWRSPYTRIPNGSLYDTVIAAEPNFSAPAVNFNLGLDYSVPFTGKVKLGFKHEDESICHWTSEEWTPRSPTQLAVRVSERYLGDIRGEYLPLALAFSDGVNIPSGVKWIAVEPMDADTEVFSIDGDRDIESKDTAGGRQLVIASAKRQDRAALYELAKPVDLGRLTGDEIKLVLKRSEGSLSKPRLRFLFFDTNANLIGYAMNDK